MLCRVHQSISCRRVLASRRCPCNIKSRRSVEHGISLLRRSVSRPLPAHIDSMIYIDPFPTMYAGMELSQLMKTTGKPLSEVVKMTCQRQAAVSELKAMGFTLTANDYGCILRYFLSPTDSLLNEVRALVPKTRTSDTAITTSTVCAHSSPRSRRRSRRLECTCSLCTCA